MYYIKKKFEISASHHLTLSYGSKCERVHGHNWHITIFCKSAHLNADGMVEDFSLIKERIHGFLDHSDLNEKLPFNPTAENLARWMVEQIPSCYQAIVQESDDNVAMYCEGEHPEMF
jgi:6-pyruvoyltetrahydropterin/6-carboxytetrahydropterin synthase